MGNVLTMPAADRGLVTKMLDKAEKTKSTFEVLRAISDGAFAGIERPPYETLKERYLNADVFVVYLKGTLVGFAIVNEQRFGAKYLWSIAVAAAARGMGLGGALLDAIKSHYTEKGETVAIELTCKVDNPAQLLYFKNGYRVQSVQRAFYGAEGDGLRMRLELTPKAA